MSTINSMLVHIASSDICSMKWSMTHNKIGTWIARLCMNIQTNIVKGGSEIYQMLVIEASIRIGNIEIRYAKSLEVGAA